MATTRYVIYATASKMIRRIIVTDEQALDPSHLGSGESVLPIDNSKGSSLAAAKAAILAATGVTPPDPHCAVVNALGVVVQTIKADPAIDSVAGMTLVSAPKTVSTGTLYNSVTKTFVAPTAVIKPSSGSR